MKKILFLCLIYSVFSYPANEKHENAKYSCSQLYVYDEDWLDNYSTEIPEGVSDCTDSKLNRGGKYYDRCCYIRLQVEGKMHAGCIALREEDYLDIAETIRKIEDGDKKYLSSETKDSKVYQLDCASSYLKIFSIVSALLALIF